MTLTAVDDVTQLDADGGFVFHSNCPMCGGGWVLEGASPGREGTRKPCTEVRQSVYCPKCRHRFVIEVRLGVITKHGHR